MAEVTDTDIRERVRERYAAAATAVATETAGGGCCNSPASAVGCGPTTADKQGIEVFGATLYDEAGDRRSGPPLPPRSVAGHRVHEHAGSAIIHATKPAA